MIFVSYFEAEDKLVGLLQKRISFFEKSFGASPKIIRGREQKKMVGCLPEDPSNNRTITDEFCG